MGAVQVLIAHFSLKWAGDKRKIRGNYLMSCTNLEGDWRLEIGDVSEFKGKDQLVGCTFIHPAVSQSSEGVSER